MKATCWLKLEDYKNLFAESTRFILYHQTQGVCVGTVDWDLVGNPEYAITHFWNDGSMFCVKPET